MLLFDNQYVYEISLKLYLSVIDISFSYIKIQCEIDDLYKGAVLFSLGLCPQKLLNNLEK